MDKFLMQDLLHLQDQIVSLISTFDSLKGTIQEWIDAEYAARPGWPQAEYHPNRIVSHLAGLLEHSSALRSDMAGQCLRPFASRNRAVTEAPADE